MTEKCKKDDHRTENAKNCKTKKCFECNILPDLVVSIDLIWAFFMTFSYNGVYWDNLVLSIYDVKVSQKKVQWSIKVWGEG